MSFILPVSCAESVLRKQHSSGADLCASPKGLWKTEHSSGADLCASLKGLQETEEADSLRKSP